MNIRDFKITKEELLNRFGANVDDHIQVVSVGESFEFYVITQKELRLIVELFDLQNPKEIEETVSKLYMVGLVWNHSDYNLKDLIDSWNVVSSENTITMIQLLDSFFKASVSPKVYDLTVDDMNNLTTFVASRTKESGSIIGNALKSIMSRVASEDVIVDLNARNLNVTSDDTTVLVFKKIKNYLDGIADIEERCTEMAKIVKLIGGNYHIVRTVSILDSI